MKKKPYGADLTNCNRIETFKVSGGNWENMLEYGGYSEEINEIMEIWISDEHLNIYKQN